MYLSQGKPTKQSVRAWNGKSGNNHPKFYDTDPFDE